MLSDHVGQIAGWLAGSDITLLELRGPGGTLVLRRDGQGAYVASEGTDAPAAPAAGSLVVAAGSVGVFLHRHPLHTAPLVRPRERVEAGQLLGLLRIGPLLLPVVAPRAGIVVALLATHEAMVGFSAGLVELSPLQGEAP